MSELERYESQIKELRSRIERLKSIEEENRYLSAIKEKLLILSDLQKQWQYYHNIKEANKTLKEDITNLRNSTIDLPSEIIEEKPQEDISFQPPNDEKNDDTAFTDTDDDVSTTNSNRNLVKLQKRIGFIIRFQANHALCASVVRIGIRNGKILLKPEYPIGSGTVWNSPSALDKQWVMDNQYLHGTPDPLVPHGGQWNHMEYLAENGEYVSLERLLRDCRIATGDITLGSDLLPSMPASLSNAHNEPKDGYKVHPFVGFGHLSRFQKYEGEPPSKKQKM